MKKAIKIFGVLILSLISMLGLVYLGLAYYYEDGFLFGTYINDVYCTGKSVEEVNSELNDNFNFDGIEVKTLNHSYFLSSDDLAFYFDYNEPLNYFVDEQIPFLWIENIFHSDSYKVNPKISYDQDVLNRFCQEIFKKEIKKDMDVYIIATDRGFRFVDHKADVLDEELAYKAIMNALSEAKSCVDLEESACYYHKKFSDNEELLAQFFKDIDNFQRKEIVYHFGSEMKKMDIGSVSKMLECYDFFTEKRLALTEDDIKQFYKNIKVKDGVFPVLSLDSNEVNIQLDEFLEEYQSYKQHEFSTYDGRKLVIKGGTYGNHIHTKTEVKLLTDFLQSNESSYDRVPEYKNKALYQEKDDIGNTYIEIDLKNQRMYYFVDGQLQIETDVVTGNNGSTPECVCFVYGKQKNRILRGADYATPVKFWIPIKGAIGIHDASWRKKFGGKIYKGNGSHGCINTPFEQVSQLYDMVEIGTPVIMYYGEND